MRKIIIDHKTLERTIRRLAYEIIEKTTNLENVILLGIKHKGVRIAEILQENIYQIEGIHVSQYELDITPFRDDIKTTVLPTINETYVKADLTNKIVILVDDVLYTGRTIRAAMDAVMKLSRPEEIKLAILIDRGHRQLPIRADYVGKNIPTSKEETIKVTITDFSQQDKVEIIQ